IPTFVLFVSFVANTILASSVTDEPFASRFPALFSQLRVGVQRGATRYIEKTKNADLASIDLRLTTARVALALIPPVCEWNEHSVCLNRF
ncbi:MAG: hypothetical protein ACXW50_24265, partial [Candidatus Binatia bacterium]